MRCAVAAVVAVVLSVGCGVDREACQQAAAAQARAELVLGEAAAQHERAHEQANASGAAHQHGEVTAARIALIIAEAETRRLCG